jgi:alpha-1,3-mannosyltransferase
LDLARKSRALSITPSILTLNRREGDEPLLPWHDENDGIPIHRLRCLDMKYYRAVRLPLKELRDADVLHVHGLGAWLDFAVATKLAHRRPIVLSTHGGIFHTSRLSLLKNLYFHGWQWWNLKFVDQVVACSRVDEHSFAPLAPRMILLENGADVDELARPGMAEKDPRAMLFVGRLAANKAIDDLLRTCAALAERGQDFTMRIVGPDRNRARPALESLLRSLKIGDRVTFVGEVTPSQLIAEYARASLFVSASRSEGFGISVVEAMAAGCVPVVNNIPAFRDLLSGARDGVIVDFSDACGTAATIAGLFTQDLAARREAARERAWDFSWRQKAPKWKQIYADVIRRAGNDGGIVPLGRQVMGSGA